MSGWCSYLYYTQQGSETMISMIDCIIWLLIGTAVGGFFGFLGGTIAAGRSLDVFIYDDTEDFDDEAKND